jgi:prophage antirepressor-like protein
MNIVKAFNENKLHTEIIIKGTEDTPLFRASDVANILDISNIKSCIVDFDETQKVVQKVDSIVGSQDVIFLTEKGLYKLLLTACNPISEMFQNEIYNMVKELRLPHKYKLQPKKYVVSNNYMGGTQKYVQELINTYQNTERIHSYEELMSKQISSNDTLFVQHLHDMNISPEHLIDVKLQTRCKIIITLHDFVWLIPINSSVEFHTIYMKDNITIQPSIKKIFDIADLIIAPTEFVYDCYKKHFDTKNIILNPHNDYVIDKFAKNVPPIHHNVITVVNLRGYTEVKGNESIEFLKDKYKTYKGYNINLCRCGFEFPLYEEREFFHFITHFNIHGLFHLNKHGETYDYSLTKSLNSGLPILYNNIGAYKTRIPQKEQYFKAIDHENDYYNSDLLSEAFSKFLDYIIENNGKYNHVNESYEFKTNALYNYLF